jgi:hypothetical protein
MMSVVKQNRPGLSSPDRLTTFARASRLPGVSSPTAAASWSVCPRRARKICRPRSRVVGASPRALDVNSPTGWVVAQRFYEFCLGRTSARRERDRASQDFNRDFCFHFSFRHCGRHSTTSHASIGEAVRGEVNSHNERLNVACNASAPRTKRTT